MIKIDIMNENLKKLRRISKKIDFDKSYVVTIYRDKIQIQCEYSSSIAMFLKRNKFESYIDSVGYLVFERKNIRVVLTE